MNPKHRNAARKWMALLAAAAIALSGCGNKPVPSGEVEADIVGGKLTLSEKESSSSRNTYEAESPSAKDEPELPESKPESAAEETPKETVAATEAATKPEPAATTGSKAPAAPSQASSTASSAPAPGKEEKAPEPVDNPQTEPTEASEPAAQANATASVPTPSKVSGEVRAVWISYLELGNLLTGKSESQFTANIATVFANCKTYGLNTVFVHVRPFGDALYQSDYFPWSHVATGTEGQDPGFDPLAIMVREARQQGLRIEAWINPYRVRHAANTKPLSTDNQAQIWLNQGDDSVIRYEGTISYNPASEKAQELIANGVREIIRKYDVDGIHIDDYFYPHTAEAFDKTAYTKYKSGGGSLSLADWRRSNVETMIQKLYRAVKEEDASVLFGISPQSSVGNNYNAQYLDVEKIVSTTGYCDYVCPQIYFGFQNETQPYAKTLDTWSTMIKTSSVDLYVGLAAYKCGAPDSWAGKGSNEWVANSDLLAQMTEYARSVGHYKGFAIYRYESLFAPAAAVKAHVEKEAANLKKLL
ncbi:family 10 glycosylhydrolase [Ruminococcaceae bacterium OttesenSCG-928-L11]|nr:family 10 glycosylhydrolase [Ruminococcaceae bacterium OttesenSCG-928-L11]